MFPDFRPDKVLRFSRLFGPGKYNSLPHTWKNVKKRRRKRKEKLLEEHLASSGGSSDINSNPNSSDRLMSIGDLNVNHSEPLECEIETVDPAVCVPDAEVYGITISGLETFAGNLIVHPFLDIGITLSAS